MNVIVRMPPVNKQTKEVCSTDFSGETEGELIYIRFNIQANASVIYTVLFSSVFLYDECAKDMEFRKTKC